MILDIVIGLFTIFALAILVISLFSYRRSRNNKLLIVTIAFALIFLKGIILSFGVLQQDADWESLIIYTSIVDLLVTILLFIAIIVRKK